VDFPVKSEDDWERLKGRFNPKDPRRYPKNWSHDMIKYYAEADYPVGVGFPGFFGQARNFMGTPALLVAFYRSPRLVRGMMEFWAEFVVETIADAVETVHIDYANIWEDMSYNAGPLISPSLFREFMLPCYRRVTSYLRRKGIDIVMVDTDGNHEVITPLFLEGGVNCVYPLEAQAGMDALVMRRKYGGELRLIGNIDKKALAEGKEAIERVVMSKLPLMDEGGYIASVDHLVPPDVPFENYVYYVGLLRKLLKVKD
jgi:uroporphyrinogen decarboxylase